MIMKNEGNYIQFLNLKTEWNDELQEYVFIDQDTQLAYLTSDEDDLNKIAYSIKLNAKKLQKRNEEYQKLQEKYENSIKQNKEKEYRTVSEELKKIKLKIAEKFPVNAEPIKAPLRIDLKDHFGYQSWKKIDSTIWFPGDQLKALRFYAKESVNFIGEYEEGDYQGDVFAAFEINDFVFIWRSTFGSCNVCDWLADVEVSNFDRFKQSLSEGNTLQFYNKTHAKFYLEKMKVSRRWNDWEGFPLSLLE